MKTHSPSLRPVSDADLAFVRALADEHSVGLKERCARYRRRAGIVRMTVATCLCVLVVVCANTAYTHPAAYTDITTSGPISDDHVCQTVKNMLEQI